MVSIETKTTVETIENAQGFDFKKKSKHGRFRVSIRVAIRIETIANGSGFRFSKDDRNHSKSLKEDSGRKKYLNMFEIMKK